MARDRITLRVDEALRSRIEAVREHLATGARPGQRAPTLSDAARHCIELGLAAVESPSAAAAPGPPPTEAPASAPPATPALVIQPPAATPLAPPTPTRSWVDEFDEDDD